MESRRPRDKVVCCRMDQENTNSGAVDKHGESLVLPSVAMPSLPSHIWPICFLQNNWLKEIEKNFTMGRTPGFPSAN